MSDPAHKKAKNVTGAPRPGSLDRMVRPLTAMQTKLVETLNGKYALNGSMSTTDLAWRNNTSRLAVWAAMRSLEAQGRAGYFRSGNDRWSASMWFVCDELKRPNAEVSDRRAHGNENTTGANGGSLH